MRKILIGLCILLTFLLGGCAKGHITLQVTRLGAADLTCKLTAVPMLKPTVDSFQEDFQKDGYHIETVKEGDYSGFTAQKHYNQLKDIKDSKVLKTFDFKTWENAAQTAVDQNGQKPDAQKQAGSTPAAPAAPAPDKAEKKPIVTLKGGLLFDTISVHTGVNMGTNEKLKNKDAQAVLENVMKQIDLQFTLILPTGVDSTNAPQVSDDKRVLTWKLPLGEEVPLDASVTYLNPVKAAGWVMVIIVLGGVALAYVRKIRRQKAMREWTARQEASARIIPLPEDQVQTSAPDKKLEQELKAKAVPEEETPETSPTEDKPEHPEKS